MFIGAFSHWYRLLLSLPCPSSCFHIQCFKRILIEGILWINRVLIYFLGRLVMVLINIFVFSIIALLVLYNCGDYLIVEISPVVHLSICRSWLQERSDHFLFLIFFYFTLEYEGFEIYPHLLPFDSWSISLSLFG